MKLRIKGNSLRFRLTQTEVEKLGAGENVEEITEFGNLPGEKLIYALTVSESGDEIKSRFENGKITIFIPKNVTEDWAKTEKISIGGEKFLSENKSLTISIEKDFACLSERENEDESDNFPNPNAGKIC